MPIFTASRSQKWFLKNTIYTDYDGYHRHHVKHYSYLSAHFSQPSEKKRAPQRALVQWRKYQPPLSLRTATAHVSTQTIWRACTSKLAVNLLVAERNNNVDCVSAVMSASLHHAPAHDCATTWRKITKTYVMGLTDKIASAGLPTWGASPTTECEEAMSTAEAEDLKFGRERSTRANHPLSSFTSNTRACGRTMRGFDIKMLFVRGSRLSAHSHNGGAR